MREREAFSVKGLTYYIKSLIGGDDQLQKLWVEGELSQFKIYPSGHAYFTLKDDVAQLKCVMFRSDVERLRFRPDQGMSVLVAGGIQVYERDGAYQMYAKAMQPAGVGALHTAYEQLKAKLEQEGLFDPARKRPLPRLPRTVGVVTSTAGAAVRDIITVATRRFPAAHLIVAPALVQGAEAPASIVAALQALARHPGIDVVLVARGGGSLEELWAFNDEGVARQIARMPMPVVSGVGHETDFTIADFVADLRAATPSNAAEIIFPSRAELVSEVQGLQQRMVVALKRRIERHRSRLTALAQRPVLQRPEQYLLNRRQRLDELIHRLGVAAGRSMERRRARLEKLAGRLDALSPLAVLGRGYAIARRPAGPVVKRATDVAPGDSLVVMLGEGSLLTRVEQIDPNNSARTGAR